MTQQPFNAAALRGAVDLSALAKARPAAGGPAGRGATGPAGGGPNAAAGATPPGGGDLLVHATDATFNALVTATVSVPAVMVLWAEQLPESGAYLQELVAEARAREGRFRVIGVELASNPGIMQALSPVLAQVFGAVEGLPVVVGLLQGQPVPFYVGPVPMEQVRPVLDQFLTEALTAGVTGRADLGTVGAEPGAGLGSPGSEGGEAGDAEEPESLPPLHQAAYDAIDRGDLDGAVTAYQQAVAADPGDEDARLGLAQVELLRRTQALDPAAVRQAAAERPDDVQAQTQAADLDLAGGHVEDAFTRLVDTVRRTRAEDRDTARQHLLGLFDLVGTADPRVGKARQALMSALY